MFRYPLLVRHPEPLHALRAEIRRLRHGGAERIGLIGFSAGGHLAGLAALAPGADPDEAVDFAVLGYAITSMETETYRPARLILLGEDATPELRRATSLDALVTPSSPPFFLWHTAEDAYVPPEHTYRLAASLAAHGVPHTVHVFAHGPHSLGLAQGERRRRGLDDARGVLDHRTSARPTERRARLAGVTTTKGERVSETAAVATYVDAETQSAQCLQRGRLRLPRHGRRLTRRRS